MHDDFFKVRLKLTILYTLTASVVIAGYSFVLYEILLSDFTISIRDKLYGLNPNVSDLIIKRTADMLQGRLLIIDITILSIVVMFSFFLTKKTLSPIRDNIEKQKRFVADASHEMRTPIAVMISGLEVSLRNKNLDLESAKQTLIETLEEMKDFSKLSSHLLDISRYDAGVQVNFENIDLAKIVEEVVQKIKVLAEAKKINITCDMEADTMIKGNSMELSRVFLNLLHNSIKYTEAGGTITVVGNKRNKKYLVTITDTGVGMNKDLIDRVFIPFVQGDLSRSLGGAGLGLTLAKRIVENHKGIVQIQSEIGKGTVVTVSLPLTS